MKRSTVTPSLEPEDTDEDVFARLHDQEPGPGQPGRRRLTYTDFILNIAPKPNGCWAWTGAMNANGRPVFGRDYAHRWIREFFGLAEPREGQWLGRACGWPDCVSPLPGHVQPMTPSEIRARREQPRLPRARPKVVIDAADEQREGGDPSRGQEAACR